VGLGRPLTAPPGTPTTPGGGVRCVVGFSTPPAPPGGGVICVELGAPPKLPGGGIERVGLNVEFGTPPGGGIIWVVGLGTPPTPGGGVICVELGAPPKLPGGGIICVGLDIPPTATGFALGATTEGWRGEPAMTGVGIGEVERAPALPELARGVERIGVNEGPPKPVAPGTGCGGETIV